MNITTVSSTAPSKQVLYQGQALISITYLDYDRNVKQFQKAQLMLVTILTEQKIIIGKNPQIKFKSYKIIVESKLDPFTVFINQWDQQYYSIIKHEQHLKFDHSSYLCFLMKQFNEAGIYFCESKNRKNSSELRMIVSPDGNANFGIYKQQKLRYVQILKLTFRVENQDKILESITKKYKKTKSQVNKKQRILEEIIKIIKDKNPSFLLQIGKKYS